MDYAKPGDPIPSVDVGRRGDEVVSLWGSNMAWTFVAFAVLLLLGEIGLALGLFPFEPGDRAAKYAWGASIWVLLTAAVAFFLGGGKAARALGWARVGRLLLRLGAAAHGGRVGAHRGVGSGPAAIHPSGGRAGTRAVS
jgi:hypothetical protein